MWPFTSKYPTQPPHAVHERTFDYIIVGGGTAGCVVASRLSEDASTSVLLVESGPVVNSWLSKIPIFAVDVRSASSPAYKWKSAADSLFKTGESLISGKVLGGTSKINANVYTRSVPGEYNAWAEAGRVGWGWDSVLPYFRKSETSLSHGHERSRGSHGPWHNRSFSDAHFGVTEVLLKATDSLGIPQVPHLHDPDTTPYACGYFDATINGSGQKHSTFDAFLSPGLALRRTTNLTICPETVGCRLKFETTPNGTRAVGLYIRPHTLVASDAAENVDPQEYLVLAKHEIILCAGAIATPQLLMLSGIGPPKHLQDNGIPLIKALLGVGSHLQDHPCVAVIYKVPRKDSLHKLLTSPFLAILEIFRYIFFGAGLLLSPTSQAVVFALSRLLNADSQNTASHDDTNAYSPSNIPDIEITPIPFNVFDDSIVAKTDGVSTVTCISLKPRSLGTVRLQSSNPSQRPACDLNWLSDKEDLVVFRRGLRLVLAIGRKCREQGYPLRDFRLPVSESDEDLDEYIRKNIRTTFHYTSTCRMAPERELGVVDDELKVHGVQGLRIADASVFPVIPSAHPQAPVVMIAERCADFVQRAKQMS